MKPFRFLAEARAIASGRELAELGISSVMVGEVDELIPVVERLAGT